MYAVQCSVYVLCVVTGHSRSDAHPSGRQPYYPLPAARRSRPRRRPQSSSGRALRRRQDRRQDRRASRGRDSGGARRAARRQGTRPTRGGHQETSSVRIGYIAEYIAWAGLFQDCSCDRFDYHYTLLGLLCRAHPRGPATNNTRPPSGAGRGADAPPTRTRTATVTRGGACAQRAGDV